MCVCEGVIYDYIHIYVTINMYHSVSGISEPKKSVDGGDLPSARIVSFMMHHDVSEHHSHINILLVFWGQMIDHDMTLAAQTLGKF